MQMGLAHMLTPRLVERAGFLRHDWPPTPSTCPPRLPLPANCPFFNILRAINNGTP
jgi:hypothetical protein